MIKEQLLERFNQLDAAYQQTLANLNTIKGAKDDCAFWLSELEKKSNEKQKTKKSTKEKNVTNENA